VGKNWSKGLTAATDGRVARAATSHRGMAYTRRKPLGECRWPNASQTTLSIEWSNEMAYIVGLPRPMAAWLAESAPSTSNLRTATSWRPISARSVGQTAYGQYLTLGAIDVPAEFLAPLARGLMDGDGSIANFVHAPTPATYPRYRYERL